MISLNIYIFNFNILELPSHSNTPKILNGTVHSSQCEHLVCTVWCFCICKYFISNAKREVAVNMRSSVAPFIIILFRCVSLYYVMPYHPHFPFYTPSLILPLFSTYSVATLSISVFRKASNCAGC